MQFSVFSYILLLLSFISDYVKIVFICYIKLSLQSDSRECVYVVVVT